MPAINGCNYKSTRGDGEWLLAIWRVFRVSTLVSGAVYRLVSDGHVWQFLAIFLSRLFLSLC